MYNVATFYQFTSGTLLEISATAITTLLRHRQYLGAYEAGGILLGYILPNDRVVIDFASEPTAVDRASAVSFERDAVAAQNLIDVMWHSSNGTCIYLGEWHSHSERLPQPSLQDRRMIRNMVRMTQMEVNFLFLVIVGLEAVWVGQEDGNRLRLGRVCSGK